MEQRPSFLGMVIVGAAIVLLTAFVIYRGIGSGPPDPPPQTVVAKATPAAVAHGGVGSPPEWADGCRTAVDEALAVLEAGGDALDAVVAGMTVLENDTRFNAGTGSRIRIDGSTVQMDASIMNSDGRFGAVSVIEHVQNPIEVARAVMDTPHLLLAGDGATRFARAIGLPHYDPATEQMKEKTAEIQKMLLEKNPALGSWAEFDWRSGWNFEKTIAEAGLSPGSDTVGLAVRTSDGKYAVGLSTGGTSITLRGRVGDVPIYGAGMYAGPAGAVAATGKGERIIEASASRTAHDLMVIGTSPADAAEQVVDAIKERGSIGLIVIGPEEIAAKADRDMAWAGRLLGSDEWLGPNP